MLENKLQLHLGCGKRFLPGFVHIDLADFPHIDFKSNVNDLPMIEDGSVDLIYASHIFEYFDRQEGENVLKLWYNKLKEGGIIRLAVPDFLHLMWVYQDTHDLSNILGPLYGRMESDNKIIYHKTVYDFKSLSALLNKVGFKDTHMYNWREVMPEGFDDHAQAYFPHMNKERGLLISLNVEATK